MTKQLSDYSSAELFELAENKRKEEERLILPKVKCYINSGSMHALVDMAESYLKDEIVGNEVDTQYAYELLMEHVYGDGIWDYIEGVKE